MLQCLYSKWGHLENTSQSHCRTKIEKINKRHISQSALGQKQFEQMSNGKNRLVKVNIAVNGFLKFSFDWTSFNLIIFSFCSAM